MKLQIFMIKNPTADSIHISLAVFSLDAPLKKDENYYPQVFLRVFLHWDKSNQTEQW